MVSKLVRLIEALNRKTLNSEIAWEQTERDGVYQSAFPDYAVRLSVRSLPEQTLPDYVITIYDQDGSVIESKTDVDLKDQIDDSYGMMRETYDAARSKAMGVDKALDDLLSYLEDEEDHDDIPF